MVKEPPPPQQQQQHQHHGQPQPLQPQPLPPKQPLLHVAVARAVPISSSGIDPSTRAPVPTACALAPEMAATTRTGEPQAIMTNHSAGDCAAAAPLNEQLLCSAAATLTDEPPSSTASSTDSPFPTAGLSDEPPFSMACSESEIATTLIGELPSTTCGKRACNSPYIRRIACLQRLDVATSCDAEVHACNSSRSRAEHRSL